MPLVRRLALLLAVEGVLLVGVGVVYAVVGASSGDDALPIELAAAFAAVAGLVLLGLARATDQQRSWARAPSIVLNVFPFPLALSLLQAGVWWVAVPMALLAGTTLYLWATPELRTTFRERT
jgi:hypothetical protein